MTKELAEVKKKFIENKFPLYGVWPKREQEYLALIRALTDTPEQNNLE